MRTLSKDQIIKVIHLWDEIMNSHPVDISKIDKPTEDTLKIYEKRAELIQRHWNDYSTSTGCKTINELSSMILKSTPAKEWKITINCKSKDSIGYNISRIEFSRYRIYTFKFNNKCTFGYFYLPLSARKLVSQTLEQLMPVIIDEINNGRVFAVIDY